MAKVAVAKPNPFIRARNYVQEVKTELEKVTWPSREDLKAGTTVVLIFLAILAVMIGVMDVIFQAFILGLFQIT